MTTQAQTDAGNRIKAICRQQRVSQLTLARALSVTPQTLSRWINGHRRLDVSHAQSICNILGVGMGDLFPTQPAENN